MRQRIITGFFFTLGVFLFVIPSFWIPEIIIPFALIVGAVAFHEMKKALNAGGIKPSTGLLVTGGIMPAVLLAVSILLGFDIFKSIALFAVVQGLICLSAAVIPSIYIKTGEGLTSGVATALIIFYITFPLYCLCAGMILVPHGWYYMVCGLFASWISDVCAYFVGVTMGKHKIVPHISPKKTWEGCVGGAIGCALIVMLYFDFVVYPLDELKINIVLFSIIMFVLGFVISCLSQIGDWLASLVKRKVGIKDYGNIFPGHGGMMDRFDSSFFTIPTGLLIALIALLFF